MKLQTIERRLLRFAALVGAAAVARVFSLPAKGGDR